MCQAFFRGIRHFWFIIIGVVAIGGTAAIPAEPLPPPALDLNKITVLDLRTAAKIALAENPSLAAAQARVSQAAEQLKQARSAYWPQLDASAGVSRVELSERDAPDDISFNIGMTPVFIPMAIENPEEYYRVGLTAKWLVFNGFSRKFSVAAARYGEHATVEAHKDSRRLLLSAVSYAYLEAQLAQENVAIAKADAAFNNRLLTEARLRYDVGAGALSDVLNFQVRGNDAKTQVLNNERAYRSSLISLATLLGAKEGNMPEHIRLADLSPTSARELEAPQTNALVDIAFEKRPDLQRTDWFIKQAEAGISIARAGYYPSVVLSATVEGQRPEDVDFEEDDFGNTVALGLSWNLFAGGLTRAKTGEAKARLYELRSLRRDAENRVASEVQNIINTIATAQEQLGLQEANTKLVQQQRDLVEKEYKSGVGSLVRLNEAQRDLTVAQGRLVLARVALREAWYQLQTTTGAILDMFNH
jgi:outer membrane protein TolC